MEMDRSSGDPYITSKRPIFDLNISLEKSDVNENSQLCLGDDLGPIWRTSS
jgi:hypothetical protein